MSSDKERLQEIIAVIRDRHLLKDLNPLKLRFAIEKLGPTFI